MTRGVPALVLAGTVALWAMGCGGRPGTAAGPVSDHGADKDREWAVDRCDRSAPGCRTEADCNGICASSAPQPPRYGDCRCPASQVCIEYATGMGLREECEPPCTDASCGASLRCAASGRCEYRSCNGGFTCPVGSACAPGANGADGNGCLAEACTTDNDCPCPAYCVMQRCEPAPGRCVEPIP